MLKRLYRGLPSPIQVPIRHVYHRVRGSPTISDEFVARFFANRAEFERYRNEFIDSDVLTRIENASEQYQSLTGRSGLAGHSTEALVGYYALIRKVRPSVIVETGVAHGTSTLAILTALEENGEGELHSIDLPYESPTNRESSDETYRSWHRDKLEVDVDDVTDDSGIMIPDDRRPGWIVPDDLRSQWTFYEGRSQRKLPEVVAGIGGLDLFIHDSNHSLLCQLFEYELAWAWLRPGGVLLSDDVNASEAFDIFRRERVTDCSGLVRRNVGFAVKRNNPTPSDD